MARKQLQNNSEDSLAVAATSGTTSLTVEDGSLFPASGDYHLILSKEDVYEVVVCTSRATNVLTVVRGQEGTTGVAHVAGTKVVLTLTPDSFKRFISDEVGNPNDDNSLGVYGIHDVLGNRLNSTDFTWVNQGSATVEDYEDGSICLQAFGNVSSHNNRILERVMPTAPFKVRATCIPQLHNNNNSRVYSTIGLTLRDSVGGRLWTNSIAMFDATIATDRMVINDYSNNTTFSATLEDLDAGVGRDRHFFEVEMDDSEVVTFRSSTGGYFWREFVHNSTAYAMDRIGFFAMPGDSGTNANNFHTLNTLVGWQEELL